MGKGSGQSKGSASKNAYEEEEDDDYEESGEEEGRLFGSEASAEAQAQGDGAFDEDEVPVKSLFGSEVFASAKLFWSHAAQKHDFSIEKLRGELGKAWTDYHRMRLVNYLRSLGPEKALPAALQLKKDSPIWEDDALLQPHDCDDPLLFEDDDDEDGDVGGGGGLPSSSGACYSIEDELARLQAENASLRRLLSLEDDADSAPGDADRTVPSRADRSHDAQKSRAFVTDLGEAIRENLRSKPELLEGRRVLDAGCGAGVLSALCSKLGASSVTAVDPSAAALATARKISDANRCQVSLLQGRPEEDLEALAELQSQSGKAPIFDILVSGRFLEDLRYSSTLLSLLSAKHRWLRQGGLVLPAKVQLWVCAADFSVEAAQREAWQQPMLGDLDLSALATEEAQTDDLCPDRVASLHPAKLLTLDLASASPEDALPSQLPFSLELRPERIATALVLYLEVLFCDGAAIYSAAPSADCNGTCRHVVLHLPVQGPPPEKTLRLPGSEFKRLEGTFSATWDLDDPQLIVSVAVTALSEGGAEVSTCRTATL